MYKVPSLPSLGGIYQAVGEENQVGNKGTGRDKGKGTEERRRVGVGEGRKGREWKEKGRQGKGEVWKRKREG